MLDDIHAFRTQFMAVDQSYSTSARAEADDRLRQLEADVVRLSRVQFELALAQIVALADNGHTAAFGGPRSRRFNRVPIRVTPFGDDFHVLRTTTPHTDLLGARIIAINGRPIAEVRDSARTLMGGTPARRDRSVNYLIESPEQLHAFGLSDDARSAEYEFEMSTGERVQRRIEGGQVGGNRPGGGAGRWMLPELLDQERGTWQALLTPEQAPWSLRDPGVSFRSRDIAELDVVVVQFRRNNSGPDKSIRDGVRDLTAAIEAAGRRNVVLDMRQNGGGDLNTTRDFMEALPDLVTGRVFVLMSPWTFSAAISSVGYLEQTAPERVTLVGEGPGDRLEFFAEGRVVTLPNTGASILYATERHDYRTGCRGMRDCHGSVVRNPIAVPSLAPDIAAAWTFEAYADGRDPGMEAVAEALRGGR
jgi:hypothetical protein